MSRSTNHQPVRRHFLQLGLTTMLGGGLAEPGLDHTKLQKQTKQRMKVRIIGTSFLRFWEGASDKARE